MPKLEHQTKYRVRVAYRATEVDDEFDTELNAVVGDLYFAERMDETNEVRRLAWEFAAADTRNVAYEELLNQITDERVLEIAKYRTRSEDECEVSLGDN